MLSNVFCGMSVVGLPGRVTAAVSEKLVAGDDVVPVVDIAEVVALEENELLEVIGECAGLLDSAEVCGAVMWAETVVVIPIGKYVPECEAGVVYFVS